RAGAPHRRRFVTPTAEGRRMNRRWRELAWVAGLASAIAAALTASGSTQTVRQPLGPGTQNGISEQQRQGTFIQQAPGALLQQLIGQGAPANGIRVINLGTL